MAVENIGEVLAKAVQTELTRERDVKASLTQRSNVIITSAGGLITLSLGTSVLAARPPVYNISFPALCAVSVALLLLVAAALTSLYINVPWLEKDIELSIFTKEPTIDNWKVVPGDSLDLDIYKQKLLTAIALRKQNDLRGILLFAALVCECIAILALSVGVALLLAT